MKKVMTLSMCLLVTITSLASDFTSNMSSNFDDRAKKETTLKLEDVKAGQHLSIKDIHGYVLYKTTFIKSGNTNHNFDFSELPNGTYFFEHEKAYQIKIIPFKVVFGTVTFDAKSEKTIYKPVVRMADNHIYVSKLELANSDVNISLYYNENNGLDYSKIYSEDISNTVNIQRVYKLSKNQTGNYKMITNANGRQYIEYFSI